jgi:hypothetical protein
MSLSSLSAFFAQVIGFYLIFMCISMLLQPQRFKKIMTDLLGHSASLFICGAMNILFGLIILVPHNIWVTGWPVLVTIIGWLTLAKGAITFFFPEKYLKLAKNLMDKTGYQIWSWIWLLIGLYLVWMGLAQSM